MRIAYVGTMGIPAHYGGFETCVEEVATRLAKQGHEITVYCGYRDSDLRLKSYKHVQLAYVQCLKNKFLDFPFRGLVSTFDALDDDFDIIHFYGSDAWPFAFLPRTTSSKTVLSLDSLPWKRTSYPIWVRKILSFTARFALYFPHQTTVDSKYVQEWYSKNFGKSPVYVPYGANINLSKVDTAFLEKNNLENKKYILFVGRLVYEKGVHYLINAFNRIDTDFELVIIGGDPYGKQYERFLRKNANKKTKFLGFVYGSEYENLCKGAYLYVTPSMLEGTSPALLTAMALGKCALVSNIPENLETIGDAGFSFRSCDTQDLKLKLDFLLNEPSLVDQMQEKAVTRIKENYNWEKIAGQLEKIYYSLTRKN
jgi:glycosyltransferase involved in cell wall biosynthesis